MNRKHLTLFNKSCIVASVKSTLTWEVYMTGLRSFLAAELGEEVVGKVVDRTNALLRENFLEEFVIETKKEVPANVLLALLEKYYPDGKIVVRGETFHWVTGLKKSEILLSITNFSEPGGARYWGGTRTAGGIGITVTGHRKL